MCPGSRAPYGPRMIAAALLGIAYVASPGPVNVATLRRGLRGGFGDGLAVQLGAFVGDLPYVTLALLGSGALAHRVPRAPLAAAGIAVLLWLGWRSLRDPHELGLESREAMSAAGLHRGAFLEGVAISATNPFVIVFWMSLSGSALSAGSRTDLPALVLGFLLGELACGVLAAALVGWGRAVTGLRAHRAASVVCGLGLIGFGLSMVPWVVP